MFILHFHAFPVTWDGLSLDLLHCTTHVSQTNLRLLTAPSDVGHLRVVCAEMGQTAYLNRENDEWTLEWMLVWI